MARDFPGVCLPVNFFIIGFAYLTNLDVLLSVWVFQVSAMVFAGVSNRLGWGRCGRGSDLSDVPGKLVALEPGGAGGVWQLAHHGELVFSFSHLGRQVHRAQRGG